jgi:methylenetetrahydrofolate dehydrogenase (NADP+)/methenyltetrahydrofolate cyclohydrolase
VRIDGRAIAAKILEDLKPRILNLKKNGTIPTLAVILIGNTKSSEIYVRQKELRAKEIGAQMQIYRFSENVTNEELEKLIKDLDKNIATHGVILQRPAPNGIDLERLEELISPVKEVDGFGKESIYIVPVAAAVFEILNEISKELKINESFNKWLSSKKIAVIGKGETAGGPIIRHLQRNMVNPAIIDSNTENKNEILNDADIVIVAVGKRGAFEASSLKNGVILIGVGLSPDDEGKTQGDYAENEIEQIASFYTPTPGGVGPVNVALLMKNVVEACENLSK